MENVNVAKIFFIIGVVLIGVALATLLRFDQAIMLSIGISVVAGVMLRLLLRIIKLLDKN